jgi:adenylate cyclase
MASIIEGFNYDIFISYRQKDNKFDGWVTRFVGDLKKELEATFKEDISIYFDENPHDGLLEMHNVDKSLEGKLKSLIFIPIISQTYCDTKSFAWQNEFCAFNRIVKEDKFGRDIKLSGGNVTSRILPVKINNLDPEDQELVEKELGGVLRPIEFIYKEPGVNRPLTPDDDEKKNLNNTRYRNQINKVANTVKGIIRAMKDPHSQTVTGITESVKIEKGVRKSKITKISIAAAIIIILLLAGIFTIPALVKKRSTLSKSITDKSIAVLPFKNLSNDPEQEYFTEGMLDEILDRLFKIGDLKVISRTSSMKFKNSDLSIKEIAKELGVSAVLEGSVRKLGNNVRITVQLIDVGSDTHLWSEIYDGDLSDPSHIFSIQSEVAQAIAGKLHAVITPQEKHLIEKIPTQNQEAYEAYLKGQFYWKKLTQNDLETALKYFELAKEKDPEFALAYAGISDVWIGLQQMGYAPPDEAGPKAMASIMKALELDSTLAQVHYSLALVRYASEWDWESGESEFLKTFAINPNYAEAHAYYSHLLNMVGRSKEAMEQIELALKLDPHNPLIKSMYGVDLTFVHRFDEAISASLEALKMDPTNPVAFTALAVAFYSTGRSEEALESWKSYCCNTYKGIVHSFDQGYTKAGYVGAFSFEADTLAAQSKTNFVMPSDIAVTYALSGKRKLAMEWLETAYEVHDPGLPYLLLPIFDSLRDDPRFQEIARKMNLPYK